jgi:hypothetical protein
MTSHYGKLSSFCIAYAKVAIISDNTEYNKHTLTVKAPQYFSISETLQDVSPAGPEKDEVPGCRKLKEELHNLEVHSSS